MKPLFRRKRTKIPEDDPTTDRVDTAGGVAGSLAVELAGERPAPTFAELLEASGDETPTALMRRLMKEARAGEHGATSALHAAFNSLPPRSRVSVAPARGVDRLPAAFRGNGYHDATIDEDGISALKAGSFTDENVHGGSHIQMQLYTSGANWSLAYRGSRSEWDVSLPFDEASEPQFRFDVTLPETR